MEFFYRRSRPLIAFSIVAAIVSVAATIGWMTAPV